MIIKLLKLLVLLAIVILFGRIVIEQDREVNIKKTPVEYGDFIVYNSFLLIQGPPIIQKPPTITSIRGNQQSKIIGIDLFSKYSWDAELMHAIMMAESAGNPNAVNKRDYHPSAGCFGSYGLMQIGCLHFGKHGFNTENKFDPETNIRVAYEIYKEQGLKAWGAFRNKSYKKFY